MYLASGLGYVFGRFNLPAFNLPFNVATFMFLAAVKYSSPHNNAHFPLKPGSPLMRNETFQEADLDWEKVTKSQKVPLSLNVVIFLLNLLDLDEKKRDHINKY